MAFSYGFEDDVGEDDGREQDNDCSNHLLDLISFASRIGDYQNRLTTMAALDTSLPLARLTLGSRAMLSLGSSMVAAIPSRGVAFVRSASALRYLRM